LGRAQRLVCLMYHRVVDGSTWHTLAGAERIFAIPQERLEEQVAHLKEAGWRFLSLSEAIEVARGARRLGEPGVLISFDDGCRSVYEKGLPVLKRHGARATVFVTSDPSSWVFSIEPLCDPRLSDGEIGELLSEGFDLGSHGVSHRPLSTLGEDEIRFELAQSRRDLEEISGRRISSLAIPGNWLDERVSRIALEVGYEAIWCSDAGSIRGGAKLHRLPRLNVEGGLDLAGFAAAISPLGLLERRWSTRLKRLPKRILGGERWLSFRPVLYRWLPAQLLSGRRPLRFALLLGALLAVGILFLL